MNSIAKCNYPDVRSCLLRINVCLYQVTNHMYHVGFLLALARGRGDRSTLSILYIFVELKAAPKPVKTWFVFGIRLLSRMVLRLPMRTNNRSQIRSLSSADWCWYVRFSRPQRQAALGQLPARLLQMGLENRLEYSRPSAFWLPTKI